MNNEKPRTNPEISMKKEMKRKLMGKISGFNSLLSKASDYWENTMLDISKTMCNCGSGRQDDENPLLINDNIDETVKIESNMNENALIIEKDIENTIERIKQNPDIYRNDGYQSKSISVNNIFDFKSPFIVEETNLSEKKDLLENIQISETTNELYNQFNDPSNNKRIWTKEEDQFLLDYMKKTNNSRSWKKISELLKTKTPQQCTYRYNKLIEEMTKKKWTRTDDIKIIELVEVHGHNWDLIAKEFPGRIAKDIEERFTKKIDPNNKKARFSDEEDELLIKLYEKYGNQWFEISKYFKSRSAVMLKNRFYSFLRKSVVKENSYNTLENSSNNNKSIINDSLSHSVNGDNLCIQNVSQTLNDLNLKNNISFEINKSKETIPQNIIDLRNNLQDEFMFNFMEDNPQKLNPSPFDYQDSFINKHTELEFLSKNNTHYDINGIHNESLLFDEISKFETKHYSFPNEEPFFDDYNGELMFIDEKKENLFTNISNATHLKSNMGYSNNVNNNIMNVSNRRLNYSSFEELDTLMKDINQPYNYLVNLYSNNNLEFLLKEMNKMDLMVEKVLNLYNNKDKDLINLEKLRLEEQKLTKFVELNKQIDERKHLIHSHLILHHKERVSLQSNMENIKKYINKQLELLIQLFYTTKLKGKLLHTLN